MEEYIVLGYAPTGVRVAGAAVSVMISLVLCSMLGLRLSLSTCLSVHALTGMF